MKNERVLIADDLVWMMDAFKQKMERGGHKVIATASSVDEVSKLMEEGLKPSVALVDNRFPLKGDGERAAEIIAKHSPETVIIAFSSDENLSWGKEHWVKNVVLLEKIVEKLTNLQH